MGNLLTPMCILAEKQIALSPIARVIISQRRQRYPNDMFCSRVIPCASERLPDPLP